MIHTIVFTILVVHKQKSRVHYASVNICHICTLHIKNKYLQNWSRNCFFKLFHQEDYTCICQIIRRLEKMDDIYSHSTSKFFLTRSSHHKFIIMVNAVVPLHVFIYKPKTHGWILSWVSILGDLWLRSSRPAWAWVEWQARYPDYTVWPGFPPLRVGSEHELAFAVQLRSEVLTPLFRVVNSPKEKGKMLTKNCFLYRYIMYIMYYSLEDV